MGGLIETPYLKQPWEQRTLRFNWAEDCQPLIDNDYAFSTLEFKVYNSSSVDVSSTMIQGTPFRVGNYVYATIKAGTDGADYYGRGRMTLTKTGSENEKIEFDILIQVREKGA